MRGILATLLLLPPVAFGQSTPAKPSITINAVHEGDDTITGTAPSKSSLTIKINDMKEAVTADDQGKFEAHVRPVKAGNFIEVTGTSARTQLVPATATVLSPLVKVSKPTISPSAVGDKAVTVTRDKGDAAVAGLRLHVAVLSKNNVFAPRWENDCVPDDAAGQCRVSGGDAIQEDDTIEARAIAPDGTQGPSAIAHPSPATLGKPTASPVTQRDTTITVTADKNDLSKPGLRIIVGIETKPSSCVPDSTTGQCTIKLPSPADLETTFEIWETSAQTTEGPKIEVHVAPIANFGKPSIAQAEEGEMGTTVTLNSNDKLGGLRIAVMRCSQSKDKSCTSPSDPDQDSMVQSCAPDDAASSCSVTWDFPLFAGETLKAWTYLPGLGRREADAFATATVNVKSALGVPILAPVREGDQSLKITLDQSDFRRFGSNLSVSVSLFTGANSSTSKRCTPASGEDNCTVSFDAKLAAGQVIHAYEVRTPPAASPQSGAAAAAPPQPASKPGPETFVTVPELGFDWGRVRMYFSLGAVVSRFTTTTPAATDGATSTPVTTRTNFSSPDAFAGLDIDFVWLTSQRCLSYPFQGEHVKLATLIAADEQCAHSSKRARVDRGQRDARVVKAMKSKDAPTDPATLSVLEFVSKLQFKDKDKERLLVPERLEALVDELSEAETKTKGDLLKAVTKLVNMELTSTEALQILEQYGYESKQESGHMLMSYVSNRLTQTSVSNGFALANSENSAHLEGGVYMPFYFNRTRWPYDGQPHALFVAPIGKLGFDSLRGTATDALLQQQMTADANADTTLRQLNFQNAVNALNKDIFRMMAFGVRLGMFTLAPTPNRAPDTIMHVDFTYGRYDNFFAPKFIDAKEAAASTADLKNSIRYPWRLGVNARLKIPGMPFFVASDLNKGVGPDDLRIFIGTRVDLSALFQKVIPSLQH